MGKAGTTLKSAAKVDITINGRKPRTKASAKAAIVGGATRTWVSGVGDDANPCSRTAPCKTFAGALSKTTDGGTIDVLDPGEFGPVTITAPVTIDGAGNAASIVTAAGGTGISINVGAGAGRDVILRDLTITSVPGCSAPGAGDGIRLVSAGAVHLENVTLRGFAGAGVSLVPTADGTMTIHGADITDNCTAGISAQRPGGMVDVTVDHATISHDGTGVLAADGSVVRLTETTISGNATGLEISGNGSIFAWAFNNVAGNSANGVTPGVLPLV